MDQSKDTSPRKPVQIDLICPPIAKDLFSEICSLFSYLAKDKSNRFIAFVDSRKQAELLASIVSREKDDKKEVESDVDGEQKPKWVRLRELNILPYRAGYEEDDRLTIQERLSNGTLAGVISTSALELGIDIPHLTIGILVGVPYSDANNPPKETPMKSDLDFLMQAENIDAILVTGPGQHNPAMVYLTGGAHLTNADLIKKRGEPPVLFCYLWNAKKRLRPGWQPATWVIIASRIWSSSSTATRSGQPSNVTA